MSSEIYGNESFSIIDKFLNSNFKRYEFCCKFKRAWKKADTGRFIINSAQRQFIDKVDFYFDGNEDIEQTALCMTTYEVMPEEATEEAINALLRSELYTFMHKSFWDGDAFPVGHWNRMPFITTSEILTDEEIYKAFDLSKEEIKLIETVIDNA